MLARLGFDYHYCGSLTGEKIHCIYSISAVFPHPVQAALLQHLLCACVLGHKFPCGHSWAMRAKFSDRQIDELFRVVTQSLDETRFRLEK
jgi:hypothetical protein